MQANEDCVKAFNALKLSREFKYIVYALTADNKEIAISSKAPADTSKDNAAFYEEFLKHLPENEPRYAVFDFEFEKEDGSGKRNRIVFINW